MAPVWQLPAEQSGFSRGCWVSILQEHPRDAQHWPRSGCGGCTRGVGAKTHLFAIHKAQIVQDKVSKALVPCIDLDGYWLKRAWVIHTAVFIHVCGCQRMRE